LLVHFITAVEVRTKTPVHSFCVFFLYVDTFLFRYLCFLYVDRFLSKKKECNA